MVWLVPTAPSWEVFTHALHKRMSSASTKFLGLFFSTTLGGLGGFAASLGAGFGASLGAGLVDVFLLVGNTGFLVVFAAFSAFPVFPDGASFLLLVPLALVVDGMLQWGLYGGVCIQLELRGFVALLLSLWFSK